MEGSFGRLRARVTPSAPEAAVLVGGPNVGDKVLVGLAFKELVARGYLVLAVGEEPRRFGSPHRTAVLAPGERPGPAGDSALDAVLAVTRQTRPPVAAADRIADAVRIWGDLRRAETSAVRDDLHSPSILAFPNGVTGKPVVEVAMEVFRRHPYPSWFGVRTHGFARPVVLLPLIERGLFDPRYRLTPRGAAARAELMTRLGIRWRWRVRAALAAELIATSSVPDLPAAFAAIDRGVRDAWDVLYQAP